MSFMDHDRFHRAARDGYLDLLQEGNRKELNVHDEDGMTPAMWAAYYGNLDALRLVVGRGGDPDKCDHYGNTALHCASGNGHIDCVSFLVNFGVNLWALDNDFHTAKDVAVLNRRDDVLRMLDQAQAKHACVNKKLVQKLKEKSVSDAEKRIKNYKKMQAKAFRKAEKEEKLLEKNNRKKTPENETNTQATRLAAFRRDSRFLYTTSPRFSDIVLGEPKIHDGAVSKRIRHRKKGTVAFRLDEEVITEDDKSNPSPDRNSDGASTSVRPLPIFREDSEVMYAPKTDSVENGGDSSSDPSPGNDRLDNSSDDTGSDFLQTADSGIGDELVVLEPPTSIFERPGFGTMAFRPSLVNLPALSNGILHHEYRHQINSSVSDSIGSASSLVRRHICWEDDDEHKNEKGDSIDEEDEGDDRQYINDEDQDGDDEDDSGDENGESIVAFLSALGLLEYAPLFQTEKIDLESLLLLSEDDLKALGMPLGPRRKLEKALELRVRALEDPGVVEDSRL